MSLTGNIQQQNFKHRYGADGLHLFDRKTGLNILLDEITFSEEAWSKAPRQVSIALTNACDLSCTHCYAPKHKAKLDFSSLIKWLDTLDQHGCIGIGFGGGEPTLYPKFFDLCQYASNQTNLAVTMTTHAHRITPTCIEKLEGHLHFVRVSMDGIDAVYEKIRGRPFKELLKKISLIEKKFPFGINYVVNDKTIIHLDEAVKIACDAGASEFLLLPEIAVRRGKEITRDTLDIMKEWIRGYGGKMRLSISENHADALPICYPFKNDIGLRAYAHIDAQGTFKRTSFDNFGIPISGGAIIEALDALREIEKKEVAS